MGAGSILIRSTKPIGQVAISGGEIAPVPVAVSNPSLLDVSPDGSTFLVMSFTGGLQKAYPLWSVRILGGSARHLSEAADAAWSPDGNIVAYSTGEGDIHLIQSDGAEDRRLASVGSPVSSICWSPDGKTIRFTKDQALWEMSSSGSDLHRVLPAWSAGQDYGHWAQDGRFFFVSSGQIWMIDERHLALPAIIRSARSNDVRAYPLGLAHSWQGWEDYLCFRCHPPWRTDPLRLPVPAVPALPRGNFRRFCVLLDGTVSLWPTFPFPTASCGGPTEMEAHPYSSPTERFTRDCPVGRLTARKSHS